ncbi:MAG: glycosyltransferase family 1 protein [Bryobacteraceae bacterium]
MIHIGINALYLIPGGVGGTEIYLRSLLAALADVDRTNRYTVFANRECGDELAPRGWQTVVLPIRATNRPWRLIAEQTALPQAARRCGIQVLLNAGFTAPALAPCPQVTVFHDLQHKRHPEHFRWFDLPAWRVMLRLAAVRSQRVIAVSKATAADLQRYYGLGPDRVRVVPHGVDNRFFEIGRHRHPQRFLLCVSTLHPHKNIVRLLRAFHSFHNSHPDFRLVLAGIRGFHTEAIEKLIVSLKLGDAVTLTGWIPRDDVYTLYREAWAFLYPSTFEGFGMPVLEALAAGIPTACSSIPPLEEVAAGAVRYFPPTDEEQMAAALEAIVTDEALRLRLATEGPARAALFSWQDCARQTLAVLEETAALVR